MKLLKNPCLGLPGCRLQKLVCSCDPELDADSFKQEIDAKAGRKRCMFRSSGVRTCFAVGRIPSLNRYSSRPRAKAENTRQSVSEPSLQTGLGRTIWALSIRCPHSDFESEADAEEKQQGHRLCLSTGGSHGGGANHVQSPEAAVATGAATSTATL